MLTKSYKFIDKYILTFTRKIGKPISNLFTKINKMPKRKKETIYGVLFISPWILGYSLFNLYPLIYSFYISLNDVDISLIRGINLTFIGFENYVNVINENPELFSNFTSYVQRMLISIPLILIFALILALFINQKVKFRAGFRTIFFFPVIIISGPIITDLSEYGALNIQSIMNTQVYVNIVNGLNPFIRDMVNYAFNNIILLLWYSGVQTLIFLSGLQKVNKELYEAASVDGASPWEAFWKITLPSVMPLFSINIIYTVVLMTSMVENPILLSASYHMFENPDTGYGYGSAIAWLLFAVEIILLLLFLLIFRARKDKVK